MDHSKELSEIVLPMIDQIVTIHKQGQRTEDVIIQQPIVDSSKVRYTSASLFSVVKSMLKVITKNEPELPNHNALLKMLHQ